MRVLTSGRSVQTSHISWSHYIKAVGPHLSTLTVRYIHGGEDLLHGAVADTIQAAIVAEAKNDALAEDQRSKRLLYTRSINAALQAETLDLLDLMPRQVIDEEVAG